MAYTTIDDPTIYFNTKLFTGNGGTNAITGVGFQPDWVWIKGRSVAYSHILHDSVRGATKELKSNSSGAEGTDANGLTSFDSDGFSLGTGGAVNNNGTTYASWNWKAGTSFTNDASATSIGTIDSAGSVSDASGFSIVSYTGTGSNGSVKHGLSTVPKIFITKRLDSASGWVVWHESIGTNILELDGTGASQSGSSYINGTVPTSSVFSISTSGDINASGGTFIAYCFAEKQGYSKFGSYTGNGNANGTFVYTGFRPAFVLLKNSTGANGWEMRDNKRPGYNLSSGTLAPNSSDAETTGEGISILSNGFKLRASGNGQNGSNTYIYMAFAESPFVNSNGVPCNAR